MKIAKVRFCHTYNGLVYTWEKGQEVKLPEGEMEKLKNVLVEAKEEKIDKGKLEQPKSKDYESRIAATEKVKK